MWKNYSLGLSTADNVHVSEPYDSISRMQVWYHTWQQPTIWSHTSAYRVSQCVRVYHPSRHITGHVRDESDNRLHWYWQPETRKQNTTYTRNTKKKQKKTSLHPDSVCLLQSPARKRSEPYSYSPAAHTGPICLWLSSHRQITITDR